MLEKVRAHLTYANVVATLSLCLVVGGGGAYAAVHLGRSAVKGRNIANNAITSPKVKNGSLRASDFATAQLPQGPAGMQGIPGIPGPTAGALAENVGPTPLTYDYGTVLDLASVNGLHENHMLRTSFPSRIFASTDAQFSTNGSEISQVSCNLEVAHNTGPESFMSYTKTASLPAASGAAPSSYVVSMPMVGASSGTLDPGDYNVALKCERKGAATVQFQTGDLIVWAVKGD
jgi:hypothetical protein